MKQMMIGGGEFLFLFFIIIPFALLLAGGIAVFYWIARQGRDASASGRKGPWADDALEILRQRYARGEITREEFQAMRMDLEE